MKNIRNEVMIGLLALAAVAAAVTLAALHQPIPTYLPLMAVTGLGALAGTTLPTGAATAPAALSGDATAIIDTLAGRIDTLITHVSTPAEPDPAATAAAADADARAAAAKLTTDLARGLPLPTPQPAPAAAGDLASGTQ